MNKNQFVLALWACFFSSTLKAHSFEVLYPYSLGKDAMEFEGSDIAVQTRVFLVDGEIESLGTESTTYDRSLNSHLRLKANYSLTDRLALRAVISGVGAYRKVEGKEEPRTIKTESFTDLKPRLEMTFFTATRLEVFFGLNYRFIGAYESTTESLSLTTEEEYGSLQMDYPHFGFVKRDGGFTGGFYFQQGREKVREVRKSNSVDATVLNLQDTVQDPTTMGIFAKSKFSRFDVYGEFAAVQAGEGGNKSDDGSSVEEDYIKLTFGATTPVSILDVESILVYKTLSYSDNRNVSLTTMPQLGLHFNGRLGLGAMEAVAGLVFAYGKDGQSIDEFNASYKLLAAGGSLGLEMSL